MENKIYKIKVGDMGFYPDKIMFTRVLSHNWEGWSVEKCDLLIPKTVCKIKLLDCKLLRAMYE